MRRPFGIGPVSDGDQPACVLSKLLECLLRTDRERRERGKRDCGEPEPSHDQRRRRQIAHRDLDEHERGAPDEREQKQHREMSAVHTSL